MARSYTALGHFDKNCNDYLKICVAFKKIYPIWFYYIKAQILENLKGSFFPDDSKAIKSHNKKYPAPFVASYEQE